MRRQGNQQPSLTRPFKPCPPDSVKRVIVTNTAGRVGTGWLADGHGRVAGRVEPQIEPIKMPVRTGGRLKSPPGPFPPRRPHSQRLFIRITTGRSKNCSAPRPKAKRCTQALNEPQLSLDFGR